MQSREVLIVVPTYNEEENIALLIDAILEKFPQVDLLIVDDSPNDLTAQAVSEKLSSYPDNRLQLWHRKGRGRGSAVLDGFKKGLEGTYRYFFEMDADFSHKPDEIPLFLETIQNCDMVVGSRYLPTSEIHDWGWKRTFFSKWANVFARAMLHIPITDYTNGYRCYTRHALEQLNFDTIDATGYVVLSEVAYKLHRKGIKILEVPTVFVNRKRGISNLRWKEIQDAFLSIVRIRFMK